MAARGHTPFGASGEVSNLAIWRHLGKKKRREEEKIIIKRRRDEEIGEDEKTRRRNKRGTCGNV